MKTIILAILVSFTFIPAMAQQTSMKWKGTLNLDSPTDIFLEFRGDTCEAINVSDAESIETMLYTLSDTLLTLQKLWGNSDCDNSSIGKYKIVKKDNGMVITLLSDECDDRSHALDNTMWTKEQ